MIEINTFGDLKILAWVKDATDIEIGALEQLRNLSKLPFAYHHIAAMPDCHRGYGMPIGGVMATEGVVVPNSIGYDIGCGMIAVQTDLRELNQVSIKRIFGGSADHKGGIRSRVPIGRSKHRENQDWNGFNDAPDLLITQKNLTNARRQLGTLGGGKQMTASGPRG